MNVSIGRHPLILYQVLKLVEKHFPGQSHEHFGSQIKLPCANAYSLIESVLSFSRSIFNFSELSPTISLFYEKDSTERTVVCFFLKKRARRGLNGFGGVCRSNMESSQSENFLLSSRNASITASVRFPGLTCLHCGNVLFKQKLF